MRTFSSTFLALLFMLALGGASGRIGAQNTREGVLNGELHQVFNKLYRALMDKPELIEPLERAQAAWFDYESYDNGTITHFPSPTDPGKVEEGRAWRENMMEQRLARLREYFAGLSEDEKLKAKRPWTQDELRSIRPYYQHHLQVPLPYQQFMDEAARRRQAAGGREAAAPSMGKEPLIKADKALNEAYDRVARELYKMHPDVKQALIKSETAWILYRDWDAAFAAALTGKKTATAEKKRQQTLESLTVERTALLRRMYDLFPEAFRKRIRAPWPAVIHTLKFEKAFRRIKEDNLPAGVLSLSQYDGSSGKDMFITEVDLNQDGVNEIIACYGGGNGGLTYLVYRKKGKRYEQMGEFFGFTLELLTPKNSFYQIGTSNKSGAGDYDVVLYQYVNGKYRLTRTDRFNQYRGYLGTE